MRRSISTNRPDSGRFDQSELAVTWKKISWPSPRLAAVTSGVPSLRRAHTFTSGPSPAGSASTCLLTSTSAGGVRPANRLSSPNGASGCGVAQDRAPPSVRPPSRSGTGSRSSPPFSRRGPAKRTRMPPFFTHCSTRSLMSCGSVPMSASISADTLRLIRLSMHDRKVGVVALGDLRERQQRALDVVERGQQRLRLLARGAGDEADAVPLRAGVEQMHGARPSARRRSRRASPGSCSSSGMSKVASARVSPAPSENARLAEALAARRHGMQRAGARARPRRAAPAHRGGRRSPRRRRRRAPPGPAASRPRTACRRRARTSLSANSRAVPSWSMPSASQITTGLRGAARAPSAIACAAAMRSGAKGCGCTAAAVERAAAGASTLRLRALRRIGGRQRSAAGGSGPRPPRSAARS